MVQPKQVLVGRWDAKENSWIPEKLMWCKRHIWNALRSSLSWWDHYKLMLYLREFKISITSKPVKIGLFSLAKWWFWKHKHATSIATVCTGWLAESRIGFQFLLYLSWVFRIDCYHLQHRTQSIPMFAIIKDIKNSTTSNTNECSMM